MVIRFFISDGILTDESITDNHENITVVANNTLHLVCPEKNGKLEWLKMGTPEVSLKVANLL